MEGYILNDIMGYNKGFVLLKKWVTSEVLGALWSPRIQDQDFLLPRTPGHCAHTHKYTTDTPTTHTHTHTSHTHTHTTHPPHTPTTHHTHITHAHYTYHRHTHHTYSTCKHTHTHIPHTTHSAESLWQSSVCDSVVLRTLAEHSQAC